MLSRKRRCGEEEKRSGEVGDVGEGDLEIGWTWSGRKQESLEDSLGRVGAEWLARGFAQQGGRAKISMRDWPWDGKGAREKDKDKVYLRIVTVRGEELNFQRSKEKRRRIIGCWTGQGSKHQLPSPSPLPPSPNLA